MGPCSKCHDCRPASLPATTTDSGSGLFTVMECHSGTYGRHLVASRDLAAGEVVFAEPPLAVGPWSSDAPLCVACLEATCDNALDICGGCGLDICLGCSHDGEECAALSRMRGLRGLSRGIKYPVLTILRMLRLRLANPEAWQRLNYLSSGSQTSDQRRRHHLFKKIAECLAGTFTAEEVVSMIGIRYTNAKSVGNGCVAIYPTFSLMNNDCSRANTSHFVDGYTKEIVLRATDFIARGDELTVSYMNDLCEGQPRRRLKIWRSWQFICTCERCRRRSDSGIKCAFCEDGFAFPTTPNEPGTIWRCGMCERQLEEWDIIELLLRAEEKLPSPGRLHKDHFLLFKRSTYVLNEE